MAILERKYYKAHRNIYLKKQGKNYEDREICVEMGIPQQGINQDTGMLVLIPAYGGHLDSNVFKKMRREYSDKYNVITLQCDYFGNKFMDAEFPQELNVLVNSPFIEKCQVVYNRQVKETEEEFNDMGIMQALDVVSTTLCCINELIERGERFNTKKVILFGSSHGAYLAHLANVICPGLYSHIIDIAAYLFPYFLKNIRRLVYSTDEKVVEVKANQFLNVYPQYCYKEELYDLRVLYKNHTNLCKIIAIHGKDDWMIHVDEKVNFINSISNAEILVIGAEDIDGYCFKNTSHEMGIDFFVLFELLMPILESTSSQKECMLHLETDVIIGSEDAKIRITYESGLPELIEIG